jgi:hypothetical protein
MTAIKQAGVFRNKEKLEGKTNVSKQYVSLKHH